MCSAGFSQDLFDVHYHFLVFHWGKLLCVCSVSCAVVAIYIVGLHTQAIHMRSGVYHQLSWKNPTNIGMH